MGECKLNHSVEDVKQKLADQSPFLPKELVIKLEQFLQVAQSQAVLNEVFHLLKKYDLATAEEQQERSRKLAELL